tara:strand:+ start:232 stop:558 length:327 start_codon:yes stop_codon:yes gene_type:complete
MANDFKNAQNTSVTTQETVYTAPAAKDSIILELDVANVSTTAVTATVKVYDLSDATFAHIVKDAPVPVGGTLQIISGQKIILEAGDYICVSASAACDIICSILEDVNS